MTSHPNTPPGTPCAGGMAEELEQVRTQIKAMTNTLFAARRPDELMDTVAAAESLKTTIDALVLGVVHELDTTHAVKPVGWASTQDSVTFTAGGHQGTGSATVKLAKPSRNRCSHTWEKHWPTDGSRLNTQSTCSWIRPRAAMPPSSARPPDT